jgi:endonuclease/exonuclease/phosphatase family metal-dependent hydrolase
MRFATWNIRKCSADQATRRLALLRTLAWDVLALQEVSPAAWTVLRDSTIAPARAYAFELAGACLSGRQPHGAALLAQNGYRLAEPRLIPGLPKAERGLTATLMGLPLPVAVASWHAPNAASEGVQVKMAGYRALLAWLNAVPGAVVLGFDGNHWNPSLELEPRVVADDARDRWLLENQFFGGNGLHRLRDAYLDHLRRHTAEYEAICRLRLTGPLAVSYVRGPHHKRVADRFDYVFASAELEVRTCTYEYDRAIAAGSDHGLVLADLELAPTQDKSLSFA